MEPKLESAFSRHIFYFIDKSQYGNGILNTLYDTLSLRFVSQLLADLQIHVLGGVWFTMLEDDTNLWNGYPIYNHCVEDLLF
jgi:hypothetical protein